MKSVYARHRWSFSLHALALVALLALPVGVAGQEGEKAAKPADPLPLNKVVMFSSGVGFFEHRGNVTGDTKVDLRFRADDINDLLKSMILEDRGGGTISTVTYGSRDPITKTLKTFPIDLTANPTLGQILDQVRGEKIQLDAPNPINGVLLGVEKRKKEVGKNGDTIEVEFLNLLTDAGLRSLPLDSISNIKLLDDKLDAELRQALQVLALGHNTDKKTVTLNLAGAGERPVRVGYIQATPVWKTSYRLVLSDKEAPYLQGWAIVENTTEGDWNNVNLTLVSGRPISYTMDLYEPLYVQRPVEVLNLYASLRAQTYGQDLAKKEQLFAGAAGEGSRHVRGGAPGINGRAEAGGAAPEASPPTADLADNASDSFIASNLASATQNAAQGGDVGELFQYVIATPVTLARQQSAMLPIVNESVKGEKVAIYNPSVQAKHPLNGLRLTNSTALHLMQGPITVFDGGAYAGDAKIEDLAPKAERLLSYALDLKTEVAPESKSAPDQLLKVKIVKGTMEISRKFARSTTYTIKNSDSKTKTVLVEYPVDADWKLVAPAKPTEKTRDMYRFAVPAEPGKPAELKVEEEQVVSQALALTNLDDNAIRYYLSQPVVSAPVKAAIGEVVKRRQAVQQLAVERQRLEQQAAGISKDQERVRQNMNQLDRATELYQRYVRQFDKQETQLEGIRERVQKLTVEQAEKQQALDQYLIGLDI